jgi:hypothetical protein
MTRGSTGDPSWCPTIPDRPGTPHDHLEGAGLPAAKRGGAASPVQARVVHKYLTATRRNEGNRIVTTLKEYIGRHDLARRTTRTTKPSRTARRAIREDVGEVRVISSPGLDAASVALPADVDLKDRAARMNEFWDALVEFQYRNVIVVALCVGED